MPIVGGEGAIGGHMRRKIFFSIFGGGAFTAMPAHARSGDQMTAAGPAAAPAVITNSLYVGAWAANLSGQPSFSKGQNGTGSIADGAVVASPTAAF